MHAVAHAHEGKVGHPLTLAIDDHLAVDLIEAQVQVAGHALHTVDHAGAVEEGAAALSAQAGGTQLEAHDAAVARVADGAGEDAIDGEAGGLQAAGAGPLDVVEVAVVAKIGKIGKGVAEPTERAALADAGGVAQEVGVAAVAPLPALEVQDGEVFGRMQVGYHPGVVGHGVQKRVAQPDGGFGRDAELVFEAAAVGVVLPVFLVAPQLGLEAQVVGVQPLGPQQLLGYVPAGDGHALLIHKKQSSRARDDLRPPVVARYEVYRTSKWVNFLDGVYEHFLNYEL